MFRFSFGLEEASKAIETAVSKVLAAGYRTVDIFTPGATNVRKVSTSEMGDAIAEAI
jgi:3-isopropylmalate dehydrogenase